MNRRFLAVLLVVFLMIGTSGLVLFYVEAAPADAFIVAFSHCDINDLEIQIQGGIAPYIITGSGPGLPVARDSMGRVRLLGPGVWTDLVLTDVTGESYTIGTRQCPNPPLAALARCLAYTANDERLYLTIFAGDGPFSVTGTGPGLPFTTPIAGVFVLDGPAEWFNLTVTELGGNHESENLGYFGCGYSLSPPTVIPYPTPQPNPVSSASICHDSTLYVMLMNIPYQPAATVALVGRGPGLESGPINAPILASSQSVVFSLVGPGTWANLEIHPPASLAPPIALGTISCPVVPPPDEPIDTPIEEPSAVVLPVFTIQYGVPRVIELPAIEPQWVYDAPNGNLILLDGVPLRLPHDADGNGFDSFVVLDVVDVEGELWVAVDLGGEHPGYIRWQPEN